MKKKMMIVLAAALLLLTVTACSNNDDTNIPATNENDVPNIVVSDNDKQDSETSDSMGTSDVVNPADADQTPATTGEAMFDPAAFSGKIQGCSYAGDNKVIVFTDQLHLYDTQLGKVTASTEVSMRDIVVQPYNDGYLIVGYDDDGVNAYLCSADFSKKEDLKLYGLLAEDFILSPYGVDISKDGKTLAIAGFRGLYLYDVKSRKLSTLISDEDNAKNNNIKISTIEQLCFINQDTELAFVGLGTELPVVSNADNVHIYGTITMDGNKLSITKPASYTVAELLVGRDMLMMPQNFDRNNGTLLVMDTKTGKETFVPFSTSAEGSDGIYCSEQGNYFATAVLGSDLTLRIYETKTGSLVHTETITHSDSVYFNRIPRVTILDDPKYCIVLLGASMSDVDTVSATFNFGD